MEEKNKIYIMIFSGLAIAINIVLGTVVKMLSIPLLFLDTVGTIFTAVVFGPIYGAIVGGLTNVVQGVISGPKIIPFAFVNIDRKSTRLNSSHVSISYAVFCLKKKKYYIIIITSKHLFNCLNFSTESLLHACRI